MKLIFALLLILIVASSFVGSSYAQLEDPRYVKALPQVLVQITLRDPAGHFVGYIEGTRIVSIDPDNLNKYLDAQPFKIVKIDGKNFKLSQFDWNEEKFVGYHSMAIYSMVPYIGNQYTDILEIKHDAYQVKPNDVIHVSYTILRPVP